MLAEPEWSAAALEPEVPDEDDPEGLDECVTLAGEEDGAEEDEAGDEEDAGADEEDDELALAELVEDGDEEDEVAGEEDADEDEGEEDDELALAELAEDGDEEDVEDEKDEVPLPELAEDGDEEKEEDEDADAEGADMVAGAEKPPPGCPAAAALEPREREDRTKAAQIKTGAFLMASSPVEVLVRGALGNKVIGAANSIPMRSKSASALLHPSAALAREHTLYFNYTSSSTKGSLAKRGGEPVATGDQASPCSIGPGREKARGRAAVRRRPMAPRACWRARRPP